jgi:hypothetical protein
MSDNDPEKDAPENARQSENNGPRYVELSEQLEELEATEIDRRLQSLHTSFYIVSRNHEMVMDALEYYQESEELWHLKNRPALDEFQQEFLRLIHNYIASYYSLYSHTQTIKNSLDDERLTKRYQEKLSEMDIKEISNFLRRFRAYTQHIQLPPLVAKVEYETIDRETGEGVERRKLVFDRDKLLEWEEWRGARSFVEEFDEHIDFLDVADEYQEAIREFTRWFDRAVREEFSDEFDEYESVVSEMQKISRDALDDDVLEAWGVEEER